MSQAHIQQVIQYTTRQDRKNARNLLVRAKNKLVKGWIKGTEVGYNDKGKAVSYCATGAIHHAKISGTRSYNTQNAAASIARVTLGAVIPSRWYGSITAWNDSPRRSKDQVIAAFDKAIDALDAS
jgi:hypothetical protein